MAQDVEIRALRYNAVAASQTAQKLIGVATIAGVSGTGTGAIGDVLEGILIIPAAAAAGAVSILDGATTIFTFPGGGVTALPTLAPIPVPIGARSQNGPWSITTGLNVSVIASGRFT